jgi:competence protein ComEC
VAIAPRTLRAVNRPLILLACALLLGSLLGGSLPRGPLPALFGLALVLLALATRRPGTKATALALCGAAVALGAAGAAVESLAYGEAPLRDWVARHDGLGPVQVHGVALEDLPGEAGAPLVLAVSSLTLRGETKAIQGRVRVEVGGEAARPQVVQGDRVSVWTELRFPRGFATPGAFDPAAWAEREGFHAMGYCKSAALVTVSGPDAPGSWSSTVGRVRSWARAQIRAAVLPGQEQALVRAMVLGDRVGIDPAVSEAFRKAGTYHVLALSGAQVALLAGLLNAGLRRTRLPRGVRAVTVSLALVAYAQLVGGDVPVVRATVVAVVMLLGRALEQDACPVNLLGAAAGLLLVHRPSAAYDLGFQLSFAATLGILLFTGALVRRLPALPLRIEIALGASLAAQAALLPLLAIHFHRLAPAALLLNLAAVPLSGALLLAGLAVVVVGAVSSTLALLAGDLAWVVGHALLLSGDVVRHAPWLDTRSPGPGVTGFLIYYAGLAAVALGAGRRGVALLAVGVAFAVWGPGPRPPDGRMHLTLLDVGQGDSLVVRSPRGEVWVVDAGGFPDSSRDIGETVVAPYLWSEGYRRLEGVVATHPHPDHVGGVPFLLGAFAVSRLWEGVAPRHDRGHERLQESLRAWPGTRLAVHRGVAASWDGVEVRVLGPRGTAPPWRTRNDDSVVLALSFGEVSLLLAGDIEARAERSLEVPRAGVLKVPHHGSRSSSTRAFLEAVRPRLALVSAGSRNRFGHPHPEVVARYAAAGARLLRTDRDGTITVSTDGREVWISTFRSPAPALFR